MEVRGQPLGVSFPTTWGQDMQVLRLGGKALVIFEPSCQALYIWLFEAESYSSYP